VAAPDQHETEAEDDHSAFEDRAKSPWRETDLDGSDQRHEKYAESVELPPCGLHGSSCSHETAGWYQHGANLVVLRVKATSTVERSMRRDVGAF
jgi:hypothetical protein